MKAMKKAEQVGRQSWLASVGLLETSRSVAADKLDKIYVDGNAFVNALVDKGVSIENELKQKVEAKAMIEEKIAALKAKLGMASESRDIQLERLSNKVDDLIEVVAKLAQQKAAEQAKPAAKPKTTTRKPAATAPKAEAEKKPAATRARKTPAKPAAKAPATKAAPKTAAKAPAKTTRTRKTTPSADSE